MRKAGPDFGAPKLASVQKNDPWLPSRERPGLSPQGLLRRMKGSLTSGGSLSRFAQLKNWVIV